MSKIAREWLLDISNTYGGRDEALVVGLSGHLGAGKTAFVKLLAKELGVEEEVTSPTFVLMKIYEVDQKFKVHEQQRESAEASSKIQIPWNRLIHIDAYRLERREELEALDWENLVADKNNLILIEWPENVGLKGFESKAHLSFEISVDKHLISVE